jgi:hypothetical protein
MSFELVPLEVVVTRPCGLGRDAPNNFPPLSDPVGRMSFDIANPMAFIKDLMGPDLFNQVKNSCIGILALVFFCSFGWLFAT